MSSYFSYSDEMLLNLVKSSDEKAFIEIYNRYWDKLLAIAFKHCSDKLLAKDIVQEVFVSFWQRSHEIEIKKLSGYLATAIKFSVFKMYRDRNRRAAYDINQSMSENAHITDMEITARFLSEYVNGIVEQLPDKCRMVFKLSREAGLSTTEIAKEMHISQKTVEAHLTKALKTVRKNLSQSGALFIACCIIIPEFM